MSCTSYHACLGHEPALTGNALVNEAGPTNTDCGSYVSGTLREVGLPRSLANTCISLILPSVMALYAASAASTSEDLVWLQQLCRIITAMCLTLHIIGHGASVSSF